MKDAKATTHDGSVVKVSGNKITSTCSEGKEHNHTLAKDAKVTCDGKDSKLSDLQPGTPVRVTRSKDDKKTATSIESGKHVQLASK